MHKWLLLGRDNNSPYDDTSPLAKGQPEKREYMAMGVVGDDGVGQPSDIVSVVFGGYRLKEQAPISGID